jgi:hypothetical protein
MRITKSLPSGSENHRKRSIVSKQATNDDCGQYQLSTTATKRQLRKPFFAKKKKKKKKHGQSQIPVKKSNIIYLSCLPDSETHISTVQPHHIPS